MEKTERLKKLLLDHLEVRAKEELLGTITRILGDADILFLSGLGIDGRQKILDVFIKQCRILKKEGFDHGTT